MFSLMTRVYAQAGFRENPTKTNNYVVDFLKIDSTMFVSIDIQLSDMKRGRLSKQEGEVFIIVPTNLLVVFNGELLSTKKEKKAILSTVDYKDIESIIRIDREKSVELYGKKGKNGALVIKCKT